MIMPQAQGAAHDHGARRALYMIMPHAQGAAHYHAERSVLRMIMLYTVCCTR